MWTRALILRRSWDAGGNRNSSFQRRLLFANSSSSSSSRRTSHSGSFAAIHIIVAAAAATTLAFHDAIDRQQQQQYSITNFFSPFRNTVACEKGSPNNAPHLKDTSSNKEKVARLSRKRTTLQVATAELSTPSNETNNSNSSAPKKKTQQPQLQRFSTQQELDKLRAVQSEMMQRWEQDEDGWRELPARAWPPYQPNVEQMQSILESITIHNCDLHATDQCGNLSQREKVPAYIQQCTDWLFQMATTLVFYNVDPQAGLQQFERLAQRGHVDSMVACGIILVEGLGVPPREEEGLAWLEKAVEHGSAQGYYELGTVYYTGIDDVVEEDVDKAFALFEKAASQDHTAAIYMVADCLVEGEGTEKSLGRAIPLFYKAAERGHRFSRQRIRELLARIDYPL